MSYKIQRHNDYVIITIPDAPMYSRAKEMTKTLLSFSTDLSLKRIIVDLSDVKVLGDSEYGALEIARREAKLRQIELVLVSLSQSVRSFLSITHMDTLYTIYDSLEEAVNK